MREWTGCTGGATTALGTSSSTTVRAARRVDLHLYEPLVDGTYHYGGVESSAAFPIEALSGRGVIGGRTVPCEFTAWSLRWYTGYTPRIEDRHGMAVPYARFGFDLPAELA